MGRLRGFLWLIAGLVVAALATIVAYTTLSDAAAKSVGEIVSKPEVQVVVAARPVAMRSTLMEADLQAITLAVDAVPEGAIGDPAEAEGQITLVDLSAGEVILARRLLDPNVVTGDGRLALFVSEEDVLMAFPATDLMSRVEVLKPGDRVDILISLEFPTGREVEVATSPGETETTRTAGSTGEELATFVVLENVGIAALTGWRPATAAGEGEGLLPSGGTEAQKPTAILFALSPQDALVLKYVKDAGGIQDIVLRAPGAEGPFDTEPVDVDYVLNRFQIPNEVGR